MDEHNPYAPSRASLAGAAVAPTGGDGTWRDGAVLVMSRDASLPPRCVRCNEPAEEPTKNRNVYWHSPWLYLLLIFNLLIYAIVAAIVRKKANVAPGLCHAHKKRRRIGIAIAWTLLLGGFVLLSVGVGGGGPAGIASGTILILLAALASVSVTRIVRATRIDAQYIRLKGCGPEFLDSIPPFAG